ncbi:MAG: DMT family transporter [Proteobacteria bacterium]|nr:DMT family transporter [Pseudomonadota bacterium]
MSLTASDRSAYFCALTAIALWSTVATGFKLGLRHLEPAQLVMLGTLISTVIFWAVTLYSGTVRLSARHLCMAAVMGLINPTLYYLVLFEAYDRLPAQIAQPLNYTWSITLALLAIPVLKQHLSARSMLGIAISYAGVVILLTQGNFDQPLAFEHTGIFLALASTVLWAIYWLANARLNIPATALMAWSFTFAAPLTVGLCLFGPGLPPLSIEAGVYGLWVGAVEMGISFLLWQRALRLTSSAARLGQLIFLSPFASLLLIGLVLGESIHPASFVGLVVIALGILVSHRGQPQASSD